jgi:hypothetical protein
MTWSDVEKSSPLERPGLLLGLIARRLGERGFLPPAGALTVRELTRNVRLPESEDRARLEDVAVTAERVRYSARTIDPAAVEESVARGRELLAHLEALAPSRAGASS